MAESENAMNHWPNHTHDLRQRYEVGSDTSCRRCGLVMKAREWPDFIRGEIDRNGLTCLEAQAASPEPKGEEHMAKPRNVLPAWMAHPHSHYVPGSDDSAWWVETPDGKILVNLPSAEGYARLIAAAPALAGIARSLVAMDDNREFISVELAMLIDDAVEILEMVEGRETDG